MKRNIIFIFGLLLLFAACQSNHDEEINIEDFSNPIEELTGMERDIAIDILASRYGGYKYGETPTRAAQDFSLSPYVVNGDTVFYVAQYADGWDIYSANHATSKVLFSSDEGVFDINDSSMPSQLKFIIEQNAKDISELSKEDISYVDHSWGGIAVTDEILNNAQTMVLVIGGGYEPLSNTSTYPSGTWILLGVEDLGNAIDTSLKLTKTKWGQGFPWNSYAKWVMVDTTNNLVQAPAGCSPIAISQYMYFTHFKDGIPANSVTTATKTSNGLDYTFSGNSQEIWNQMAISGTFLSESTSNAALLIGNTGRQLKTIFSYNGSLTYYHDEINFLKSIYGKSYTIIDFNIDKVKEIIKGGYPIIASARTNIDTDGTPCEEAGHLFLIDKYQEILKTQKYKYGLVRDKSEEDNPNWIKDLVDANGNIIKYAYTKETTETNVYSRGISMNWGYSGSYDNILYSPFSNWNAGGHNFNLQHKIYVTENN